MTLRIFLPSTFTTLSMPPNFAKFITSPWTRVFSMHYLLCCMNDTILWSLMVEGSYKTRGCSRWARFSTSYTWKKESWTRTRIQSSRSSEIAVLIVGQQHGPLNVVLRRRASMNMNGMDQIDTITVGNRLRYPICYPRIVFDGARRWHSKLYSQLEKPGKVARLTNGVLWKGWQLQDCYSLWTSIPAVSVWGSIQNRVWSSFVFPLQPILNSSCQPY